MDNSLQRQPVQYICPANVYLTTYHKLCIILDAGYTMGSKTHSVLTPHGKVDNKWAK